MKVVLLVLILAVIAYFIYFIGKNKDKTDGARYKAPAPVSLLKDTPVSFGYKCMWIAVKTSNKERVGEMLGLKNMHAANWKTGIEGAYDDKVFISPQVGVWTLAIGFGLSNVHGGKSLVEENYKAIIDKLSAEFGEAQFFGSHRVVEYQTWAKSVNGKTVRYYSYIGEKGENLLVEGEPTDAEKQYHLINTFSKEAKDEHYIDRADLVIPDEDFVMKIAGAWSVNPITLEQRTDIKPGPGILGKP